MSYYLDVTSGPASGARLDVTGELTIGREQHGAGTLGGDRKLSRAHARFSLGDDGSLIVEDLGSLNGTFVNGRRIHEPTALEGGDSVRLGGSVLEVLDNRPTRLSARRPDEPAVLGVRRPVMSRRVASIAGLLLVAIAAVVIVLATGSSSTPSVAASSSGATVYVLSNRPRSNANSVIAVGDHLGALKLRHAYPTGGSGSAGGPPFQALVAGQQIASNSTGTLLFAVNQGSDSIAVFRIAADGALSPVTGSPFPSGGTAPVSITVRGRTLIVVNQAADGVRALTGTAPDVATFTINPDGTLTLAGGTFAGSPGASPTQGFLPPGGDPLIVPNLSTGDFLSFTLSTAGALTPGPVTTVTAAQAAHGAPPPAGAAAFLARLSHSGGTPGGGAHGGPPAASGAPGSVGGPPGQGIQGIEGARGAPYLYAEIPVKSELLVYRYHPSGGLTFVRSLGIPGGFLAGGGDITPNGRTLYVGGTFANTVSAFDISNPANPRPIGTIKLRGGGNTLNMHVDPAGTELFVLSSAVTVPPAQGNLLHVLRIGAGGVLSESSNPVPVAPGIQTSADGLLVRAGRR